MHSFFVLPFLHCSFRSTTTQSALCRRSLFLLSYITTPTTTTTSTFNLISLTHTPFPIYNDAGPKTPFIPNYLFFSAQPSSTSQTAPFSPLIRTTNWQARLTFSLYGEAQYTPLVSSAATTGAAEVVESSPTSPLA